MSTVSQVFDQKGLVKWWTLPGQAYGQNGERGHDFGMPLNTPVGAIQGGTVKYAADTGVYGLGYVVQVVTPGGQVYHYQHLNSANVHVGQQINPGDVIGLSGGPGPAYYQGVLVSSGPHIEVRYSPTFNPNLATGSGWNGAFWSDGQWVNPMTVFQQDANSPATGSPGGLSGGAPQGAPGGLSGAVTAALAQAASVPILSGIQDAMPRIGLFLLALTLTAMGAYFLFKPQADQALKKGFAHMKHAAEVGVA